MKTLKQMKRLTRLHNQSYSDLELYEQIVPIKNAYPRKYIWVFNSKGENITHKVAFVLKLKTSRSKRFFGALMANGGGYYYCDYLASHLERANYRNEHDIDFAYFTSNGPT